MGLLDIAGGVSVGVATAWSAAPLRPGRRTFLRARPPAFGRGVPGGDKDVACVRA